MTQLDINGTSAKTLEAFQQDERRSLRMNDSRDSCGVDAATAPSSAGSSDNVDANATPPPANNPVDNQKLYKSTLHTLIRAGKAGHSNPQLKPEYKLLSSDISAQSDVCYVAVSVDDEVIGTGVRQK